MQRLLGLFAIFAIVGTVILVSFHLGSERMLDAQAASDTKKDETKKDVAKKDEAKKESDEKKSETEKKAAHKKPDKNHPLFKVVEGDSVIGDAKAPVTIIEYASLSCPHCKSFHDTIYPDLKSKYIDKGIVKFVYRHFPLNEPALRAAVLAECSGKDRRDKFVDVLFELQDKWAFETDFVGNLQKIASVGGVSQEQFSACMTDTKLEEKVIKIRKDAADELNIAGTPTFFVNSVEISGRMTLSTFDKVIKDVQDK